MASVVEHGPTRCILDPQRLVQMAVVRQRVQKQPDGKWPPSTQGLVKRGLLIAKARVAGEEISPTSGAAAAAPTSSPLRDIAPPPGYQREHAADGARECRAVQGRGAAGIPPLGDGGARARLDESGVDAAPAVPQEHRHRAELAVLRGEVEGRNAAVRPACDRGQRVGRHAGQRGGVQFAGRDAPREGLQIAVLRRRGRREVQWYPLVLLLLGRGHPFGAITSSCGALLQVVLVVVSRLDDLRLET